MEIEIFFFKINISGKFRWININEFNFTIRVIIVLIVMVIFFINFFFYKLFTKRFARDRNRIRTCVGFPIDLQSTAFDRSATL